MPDKVTPWAPSPAQQLVVSKYALGYNWHRSCVLADVPWSTVADWRENPDFMDYANTMRDEVILSAEPQYAAVIEKAQAILLRVGDEPGDLDPRAPLALWAERILGKTLWPLAIARGLATAGLPVTPQTALRITAGDTSA